jgi:hypothetical protein
MNKPHDLVIDASNLLYRAYYANPSEQVDIVMGLAMHAAFLTMNKYFKKYRPDRMILAFDRTNWRKGYTLSEDCYSKRIYKGLRRKDSTPAQAAKYVAFQKHIGEFETIMREYTTIITLSADLLEGDDCIAAWVTRNPERSHTIVSGDKDFVQLLKLDDVTLIDPATDKPRMVDDPEYYMFYKLFRGEPATTDNVCPAYPKLRETKIKEAYTDPFALTNLRNATWTDHTGRIMEVGKLLDENKLLMDLTAQPDYIQELMDRVVVDGLMKKQKFSHFHFLKFLGKYELKKIAEQLETFVPMLSKTR